MSLHFAWDPRKARLNEASHGVTFTEAATCFHDGLASIFDDPDHSLAERREILVGRSVHHRLLFVSFTQRGDTLRIISARLATRSERERHEENQG
jgi:uncharacterized DUF497 family protein